MKWLDRFKGKVEKSLYPNIDEIKARYEAALPHMFTPVPIGSRDGFDFERRVIEISYNDAGRMGVVLNRRTYHTGSTCFEVIEVNKDLSLSKKGAYWTRVQWSPGKPRAFAFSNVAIKPHTGFWMPVEIIGMSEGWMPQITFDAWKIYMEPWQ